MFEEFQRIINERHKYAKDWKERTGGRVMGCICSYVPEEILYAAGILPVRILGGHEPPTLVEAHISGQFCAHCRDCLEQGLKGRYDYLDGMVHAHTCLHIRQTFNVWETRLFPPYSYFLYMPTRVTLPSAKTFLIEEYNRFKHSLEEWMGRSISWDDLYRAIEVYNTNRRLMRQIYELRKKDPPLLSGLEAMEVVLSSLFMDKAEHNQLLEQVLEGLAQRNNGPEPGVRLMMFGGLMDDLDFMKMVESAGSNVVIDEQCAGSRYFWNETILEENPLSGLASRYLDRPPCPVKDTTVRRRASHILNLARDYNVQGAIVTIQKFCEPHGFDNRPLADLLEKNNIPTYTLETDITNPIGQFRTRVEAFVEQFAGEDLF